MNKLTDFYTQKAALQEKGETASAEWDALEERLIREEVMPELLQQLKATLSQVKCPLMLNVSYDPNGALAVSFTRNCMQMSMMVANGSAQSVAKAVVEEPTVKVEQKEPIVVAEPETPIAEETPIEETSEVETPIEQVPEQEPQEERDKITRSKSIGFSVTFQDGTVVKERKAAMTFIATLQKIGLARIAKGNHNVMHMGHKVVSSDKIVSNIKKQTFVDGYYVYTHMSNADKINDIIALSRYYNLKLIVAKCEEDEEPTAEETPSILQEPEPKKELTLQEKFYTFMVGGKVADMDLVKEALSDSETSIRKHVREHIDANADSIFSFTDADDVAICIDILKSSPDFIAENKARSNTLAVYLDKYLEFVKSL